MESGGISESRWKAVIARQHDGDDPFVYAVKTTGVFCRPGCSSRVPKKENVVFFNEAAEARKAGFRPCKRCNPLDRPVQQERLEKIIQACRRIDMVEQSPSLETLASEACMSPGYFQRTFKEIVGLSPKQFAMNAAARKLKEHLKSSRTVTEAIYAAGFNASSRVYEKTHLWLSMTPGAYRKGGAGVLIVYGIEPCSIGLVLAASTLSGISTARFFR